MRNTIWSIVLGIISVAYPVLWYVGRAQGWFVWLAMAMAVLWGIRAWLQRDRWQRGISALISVFFVLMLCFRLPESMYWYPVLVNVLMLFMFGSSLLMKQTVIERLARLQTPDLPIQAIAYTRTITQIWCVFFVVNGGVAALLAAMDWHQAWAIYTGVIAYILMGLLMGGEFLYRKYILKV